MSRHNRVTTGRAGEFLVAALLQARGLTVSIVDTDGFDLWVQCPSGRVRSVEVKTARGPHVPQQSGFALAYPFNLGKYQTGNVPRPDLVSYVALDRRLCIIRPFDPQQRHVVKVPTPLMSEQEMESSIRVNLLEQ